ncbi:MAG: rod shape-determining protein RodA, partial [Phenylobacterium sp.]
MTVSALTRPGERDRLVVKLGEIDWIFCLTLCLIAGAGATMLFSIAGSSWTPWAAAHLARFALFFAIMIVLSLIDLRVWFALAYPVYAI